MSPEKNQGPADSRTPENISSFLCMIAEVARVETMFLSGVVINKQRKKILRLSGLLSIKLMRIYDHS